MHRLQEHSPSPGQDLIERAQAGHKLSIEKLFSQIDDAVHKFIRSKSSNSNDIEDLVQDTYLQALSSISRFQNKASFSTWVMGIALNVVRNHYNRSPQYKYMFNHDVAYLENIPDSCSPEKTVEKQNSYSALEARVECLPEAIRETVTMYAFYGLSYEEISTKLNVSVSCVKSRLYRGRLLLKVGC